MLGKSLIKYSPERNAAWPSTPVFIFKRVLWKQKCRDAEDLAWTLLGLACGRGYENEGIFGISYLLDPFQMVRLALMLSKNAK